MLTCEMPSKLETDVGKCPRLARPAAAGLKIEAHASHSGFAPLAAGEPDRLCRSYPPANLPLPIAMERYQCFLASPESWILNRLVLPAAKLREAPLGERWRVTLLVDEEPGSLPPQVETLETKDVRALLPAHLLRGAARSNRGRFAKVRTGGLTPDAIPSSGTLASVPVRGGGPADSFQSDCRPAPSAAFPPRSHLCRRQSAGHDARLSESSSRPRCSPGTVWARSPSTRSWKRHAPDAFDFQDDQLAGGARPFRPPQIRAARRDFAHSFGSCSFEEPVSDLRELGLLP